MSINFEEKEAAKMRLLAILEEILDSGDLDDFIKWRTRDNFERWCCNDGPIGWNVFCANGTTKAVLWDDCCDFVLKIPFALSVDWCEKEVINYQAAIKDCLEDYFAWTEYVKTIHMSIGDIPVYIMEYVDCDEEAITDTIYSEVRERADIERRSYEREYSDNDENSRNESFSDDWYPSIDIFGDEGVEILFQKEYGIPFTNDLFNWMYDHKINDMHAGNVGYIGYRLVCVDYSGYKGG